MPPVAATLRVTGVGNKVHTPVGLPTLIARAPEENLALCTHTERTHWTQTNWIENSY
jgi:hypothetical protein